jgi:uncharacterized protein (TIGR00303 family)
VRVVLICGGTKTARIEGLSAAGASAELTAHTPAADAEIVAYGRPVCAPVMPVSPTGCPTPAVVTRAVRELVGFDVLVLDAGLSEPTAAPTLCLGDEPGRDVRKSEPVPAAGQLFKTARELGEMLPDDELLIGETIPGGTTTALAVLRALGEPFETSSSHRLNPLGRKHAVVEDALAASDLDSGDTAGDPIAAVRFAGDPVLAVVAGLVAGAHETGTTVTLAGGTQLIAAMALLRHAEIDGPVTLATTPFIADDSTVDLRDGTDALEIDLVVTDPNFDRTEHVAMERYQQGEAKEGVCMGGALHLADREGVSMAAVRERIVEVYERVVDEHEP